MRKLYFPSVILLTVFCGLGFTQTPTSETPEKVHTEEIRVNVNALDRAGNAAVDLKKEDLVISEDGRLHQATSARALPASVLIAMDTGGSMRQKRTSTLRGLSHPRLWVTYAAGRTLP